MSVLKRGNVYHYRFMIRGKIFAGPCAGCTTKAQAEKFEKEKRRSVGADMEDIRANRTVKALVENYRKELSGGKDIALADAFALASAKPSRHVSRSSYAGLRETYWKDFAAFMAATYPDAPNLADVRRSHCEAYVSYLMENGRFVQTRTYTMTSIKKVCQTVHAVQKIHSITPKTIKEIVSVCKGVFAKLEEDAGLARNPWQGVVLPVHTPVAREIFTDDELERIGRALKDNEFVRPLFIIAANSGMTEGDICTLKWDDIDYEEQMIYRDRRKTGTEILAPLLPELEAYLQTIPRTDEYVLPDHARRYLAKGSNISYYIQNFLTSLGIKTTVDVPGRKSVSIKDLHSLRHVFAYRARKAGVQEHIIAKIIGHKILEMTRHYADHDTADDIRSQIQKLPVLFLGTEQGDNQGEVEGITLRRQLAELAYSLPLERVQQILREVDGSGPLPMLQP